MRLEFVTFLNEHVRHLFRPGWHILDVGSYAVNWELRTPLTTWGEIAYVGLDMREGPNVDVVCKAEDAVEEFGPDVFDMVISSDTFEHVKDWRTALSALKVVLKPSGIFAWAVPGLTWAKHDYPDDYWRFVEADFPIIFADFETIATDWQGFYAGRKPAIWTPCDLSAIEVTPVC